MQADHSFSQAPAPTAFTMSDDAVPLWRLSPVAARAMTPGVEESFYVCLAGVVITPLVLPWRYIAHHYFSKPGQRWRN